MLVDDATARRIRAAIALGGYNGVPALARELGPGWGQDTLYEVLAGKKEIPVYVLREIARVCELPYEFFTVDFATLEHAPADSAQQVIDRLNEMDRIYREFIQDVRDTVIGTAGQVQNELDAARRAHELPTQRLDQEGGSPVVRGADRRRTP